MRTHNTGVLVAVVLYLAAAGSARAGFISIDTNIQNQGDIFAVPDPVDGTLAITAPAVELPSFAFWGTLDSDPNLTVTEKITNNSSGPWDSFSITVNPGDGYEVTGLEGDTPATKYTDWLPTWAISPDGLTITFSGGSVPVGQQLVAVFDFDITDVSGAFRYGVVNSFHVATAPTPEPASLAMVGLGAALLLRRRRS